MRATEQARRVPSAADRPIRVLIVDDSAVARAMLARAIADHPGFVVIDTLDRADRALDWLDRSVVDVVLLDIEMPGRDGLEALPDLIARGNGARIVIVSSFAAEGAAATLQALSLGAADAIAKPDSGSIGRQFAATLTDRLLRIVHDGRTQPGDRAPPPRVRHADGGPIGCVAIGASTGGIHALAQFFAALPTTFDAPILVTQHLPQQFMSFFATQLATVARRPCFVARDDMPIKRGCIYIAPGDAHLALRRRGETVLARLQNAPSPSRCMPSVDPMFDSVAEIFGTDSVGIVLSGMGRDGAAGSVALAASGASILVQDEQSAVIWGMPGSVVRAGLASLIATPTRIAEHLAWRGTTV